MSGRWLLSGLMLIPVFANRQVPSLSVRQQASSFRFHLPKNNTPVAIPFSDPQKTPLTDPASLKQSSWYAGTAKEIEAREYLINYQDRFNCYSSPNRQQNLRAFYSADRFTLSPRNHSLDQWKLSLQLLGIYSGKKKIFSPSVNSRIEQNENTIRFHHGDEFITEYINSPAGVRQNFIINRDPADARGSLHVKLMANSDWFINKVHAREIHFARSKGAGYEKKITYNDLKAWDAGNKELKASFSVKANEICIDVLTSGAVYPITIDPISTTANWNVESNQASAQLGLNLGSAGDVNGDGYSDVIVSAPYYDNGQTDEGVVYVYNGSATGLSASPSWTMEGNVNNLRMGYCVNTAGDVNGDGYSDVIVGTPYYANGQTDEGVAFVYHGSATGLSLSSNWTIESNQANSYFGRAVACAGDVNGDGYSDVVIGAPYYDSGQTDEGKAFVYHGSAAGLSVTANWTGESDQAGACYGATEPGLIGVGIGSAGDVNGDGYSDIIVASVEYDNGQTNEGKVFVYHGSASGLSATANWNYESDQAGATMGNTVAAAGDVNGDGYGDVIVGAHAYDNGQSDEGRAYVFYGSASGLGVSPAWTNEINIVNAQYGCSVACLGDANNDGYADILVGALGYSNGQSNEGAAYAYFGSSAGLPASANWMLESNLAGGFFGCCVASAGDVNGDGFSDVLIGELGYNNGQSFEGSALAYYGSASGITTPAGNVLEINQAFAYLGTSVASAGDVNGDGYSDVIVGSSYFDNGQTDEGAAFVFHGSATGVNNTIRAQLEINQADARMGNSVASAGDVNGDGYSDVIVGAYYYTNGEISEGTALVYLGSASGIITTIQAQLEINQVGAAMGYSVSSAGDVNGDGYSDVIVGAQWYTNGQSNEGGAFVYHGSAAGISTTIKTQLECNVANAHLGCSVAYAGDVNGDGFSDVIVGGWGYSNGQSNEGGVFVYHGSSTGITLTVQTQLESNQVNALMGYSVASAGDVNGDGYSDVLVGAEGYDNGQIDEGMIFVYHGSPTGVTTTIRAQFESNQANGHMGSSVSSAGDLNGDGYSDIVISVPAYANGETNEGEVLVYHGSTTGINLTVQAQMESNQTNAYMGYSVASAGDVNGDGYSDLIIGVEGYTNGSTSEGAVFIYFGDATTGKKNNLRLYNTNLTTPITHSNINNPNLFGAGLFSKSPLGRAKGRLVWEVKQQGQPFSGNPITNSASYYDRQISFTDMGIAGIELKNLVQKRGKQTKIRARVEYSKATAITGQVYGPWKYLPGYTQGAYGMNAVPLPLEFITFAGQYTQTNEVQLHWITTNEINTGTFIVERSSDGLDFNDIGSLDAKGNAGERADYAWLDKQAPPGRLYYRLRVLSRNGDVSFSRIISLGHSTFSTNTISPNPVPKGTPVMLSIPAANEAGECSLILYDVKGSVIFNRKQILQTGFNAIAVETKTLIPGTYLLLLQRSGYREKFRFIVQ